MLCDSWIVRDNVGNRKPDTREHLNKALSCMIANTLVTSSITDDFDGLPPDFEQYQWYTMFAHTVMSHKKLLNTAGTK